MTVRAVMKMYVRDWGVTKNWARMMPKEGKSGHFKAHFIDFGGVQIWRGVRTHLIQLCEVCAQT